MSTLKPAGLLQRAARKQRVNTTENKRTTTSFVEAYKPAEELMAEKIASLTDYTYQAGLGKTFFQGKMQDRPRLFLEEIKNKFGEKTNELYTPNTTNEHDVVLLYLNDLERNIKEAKKINSTFITSLQQSFKNNLGLLSSTKKLLKTIYQKLNKKKKLSKKDRLVKEKLTELNNKYLDLKSLRTKKSTQ